MLTTKRLIGFTLVLTACAITTQAAPVPTSDTGTPNAAAIVDKYIEATGGQAAYQRIHNRVSTGYHEFVGMGLKGTQTRYEAKPNLTRSELELEALGGVKQGVNGEVAWYLSDMTGPLIEEGEPKAVNLADAAFDRIPHWRKYYKHVEYTGTEEVDGKKCHVVAMTPTVGQAETWYLDAESNLLVKAKKTRLSSQMGPMPVEIFVSDYKWVDGLLLPHQRKQVSEQCGNKREIVFVTESIKHNVDLPSDRFDLPQEIQDQLAKRAGGGHVAKTKMAPCGAAATTAQTGTGKPAPCGKPKRDGA